MNIRSRPIARAVLDLWSTASKNERNALLDAALHLLEERGLMHEFRVFPRILRDEWQRRENIVPATLKTPEGDAGSHAVSLASILEKTLGKKIAMEEKADGNLIGGAELSFGDDRYDRSIRAALEQFETHVRASAIPVS
ncbi:MAG: F0F1 ATP synthase subunit delta [Patescibacteria group bacterium]